MCMCVCVCMCLSLCVGDKKDQSSKQEQYVNLSIMIG